MNFKEHLIFGSISGAVVLATSFYMSNNIEESLVFCAVTVAGSLVPDIDTGSVPSRIFAWIGIAVSCMFLYHGNSKPAAIIGIIYMLFSSDKHRGFTHKWILPIACLAWAYFFKQTWPVAFGIGLATHYVCDKIPPYKII